MAAEACTTPGCTSPVMGYATGLRVIGKSAPQGLCHLHAFKFYISHLARRIPTSARPGNTLEPAGAYQDWVIRVLDTGTLTAGRFTLTDLTTRQLSELTGLHRVTISRLANRHTSMCKPPVTQALAPYLFLTSPEPPAGHVTIGSRIGEPKQLRLLPPLTGVVDRWGRLWQLRASGWGPAHVPGTTSRYMPKGVGSLKLPVRVVYLPPRLQNTTQD